MGFFTGGFDKFGIFAARGEVAVEVAFLGFFEAFFNVGKALGTLFEKARAALLFGLIHVYPLMLNTSEISVFILAKKISAVKTTPILEIIPRKFPR